MKNIFISYSNKDFNFAKLVFNILHNAGYEVWLDVPYNLVTTEKIKNNLESFDIFLAIITENSITSNIVQSEWGYLSTTSSKLLFVIEIGEIILPSYVAKFANSIYKIDSFNNFNQNVFLERFVQLEKFLDLNSNFNMKTKQKAIYYNRYKKIETIKNDLLNNHLSLVLGTGISSSIGLPDWNTLLLRILSYALHINPEKISIGDVKKLTASSNLILSKYLKMILGEELDTVISNCLYKKEVTYKDSALLTNIVELIRPKRNKGHVESIINFNFDALLEMSLDKNLIKYKPIYDEDIKFNADEIPIYHIYGYIPMNQKIEIPNLIFSEEDYYNQFIDQYHWSNLIQLNKYMNNSCLFLGVSLSDLNLRRILNISKRKNSNNINKHFIIKKLPPEDSPMYDLQLVLEEQDALTLGLNVIWLSNSEDYSDVLEKILYIVD